jgi:peroxygenase
MGVQGFSPLDRFDLMSPLVDPPPVDADVSTTPDEATATPAAAPPSTGALPDRDAVMAKLAAAPADDATPTDEDVLKKHIEFFDRNHDGKIEPDEVKKAMAELGLSPAAAGVLTKIVFAGPTDVKQIEATRHADTGAFSTDGRFDEQKFDAWFDKTDRDGSGTLSRWELLRGSFLLADGAKSFFLSVCELQPMYSVLAKHGPLTKDAVRDFFTGKFLDKIAAQRTDGPPANG